MPYFGNDPNLTKLPSEFERFSVTADGGATYTIPKTVSGEDFLMVFIDGVYQEDAAFTVSGTTLTFDENVTSGLIIEGRMFSAGTVIDAIDKQKLAGIEANANNYSHPNHTGDVTSTGDGATVIADDVVTNAKAADMAADTIKGRANGAGTGDPTDLTAAQVRTIINVEDGATADQTDAEIRAAVEAATDSNVFTDADHTKLNGLSKITLLSSPELLAGPNLTDNAWTTIAATTLQTNNATGAILKIYQTGSTGTGTQGTAIRTTGSGLSLGFQTYVTRTDNVAVTAPIGEVTVALDGSSRFDYYALHPTSTTQNAYIYLVGYYS